MDGYFLGICRYGKLRQNARSQRARADTGYLPTKSSEQITFDGNLRVRPSPRITRDLRNQHHDDREWRKK